MRNLAFLFVLLFTALLPAQITLTSQIGHDTPGSQQGSCGTNRPQAISYGTSVIVGLPGICNPSEVWCRIGSTIVLGGVRGLFWPSGTGGPTVMLLGTSTLPLCSTPLPAPVTIPGGVPNCDTAWIANPLIASPNFFLVQPSGSGFIDYEGVALVVPNDPAIVGLAYLSQMAHFIPASGLWALSQRVESLISF